MSSSQQPEGETLDALSPAALFEQVRAGRVSPAALQWLSDSFDKYERDCGELSLERCLGVATHAHRRRALRDYYIREAAAALPTHGQEDERAVACALGRELDAFIGGGTWREWRRMADPPLGASPLRQALFFVAKALDDKPRPGDKQLQNILLEISST